MDLSAVQMQRLSEEMEQDLANLLEETDEQKEEEDDDNLDLSTVQMPRLSEEMKQDDDDSGVLLGRPMKLEIPTCCQVVNSKSQVQVQIKEIVKLLTNQSSSSSILITLLVFLPIQNSKNLNLLFLFKYCFFIPFYDFNLTS